MQWVLGRETMELWDDFFPDYVHLFTKDEIGSELHDEEFDLVFLLNGALDTQ